MSCSERIEAEALEREPGIYISGYRMKNETTLVFLGADIML